MNQADPFFFASGRRVPGFFEARGGGPRLVAFVDAKISSDPRCNFPIRGERGGRGGFSGHILVCDIFEVVFYAYDLRVP